MDFWEQDQRLQALARATSTNIIRINPDWTEVLSFNESNTPLAPEQRDPINLLRKYIHAADQQPVMQAIDTAMKNKTAIELECRMQIDGSLKWNHCSAMPVRNIKNEITEWFVTATDITARKNSELQLEEAKVAWGSQKRLYEVIMNATPDLVYVFDLEYRFTYANKALLNMWGKTAEDAIGKGLRENGYEEWHASMHEREIDQIIITKAPVRGVVSFPHAILGKRYYDYILVPVLNDKQQVEAVAGTTRDITEIKYAADILQESEERFRNLADESPMFVFIIEPGANAAVSYWNKTWLQYTGQTEQEARGDFWNGVIHPDDLPGVMQFYAAAWNNQESYVVPAVRVKRFDNTYRWHTFKGNPRYLTNGEFNGYIGVGLDIHEQKVAEDMVRRREAELQEIVEERTKDLQRSNEDLQQFAHVASHDLKEPVRKILTFNNLLRKQVYDDLPKPAQSNIDKIDRAGNRIYTMIDGILQYSSFDSMDQPFEMVYLNEILRNIEEDLELVIQQKKAHIQYDDLHTVHGSSILLHQVFYNLINNALKFTFPDRAPLIIIKSEDSTKKEIQQAGLHTEIGYLKITITDNGIGFHQDEAAYIFQTFSRLNSKDQYEGTGLGLALCKKIIKRHGGAISAQSEKDKGATFIIHLPKE